MPKNDAYRFLARGSRGTPATRIRADIAAHGGLDNNAGVLHKFCG